jgi:hypothetical protein
MDHRAAGGDLGGSLALSPPIGGCLSSDDPFGADLDEPGTSSGSPKLIELRAADPMRATKFGDGVGCASGVSTAVDVIGRRGCL